MKNKYPWIGVNQFGHNFVFYDDGVVYSYELKKFVTDTSYFSLCENVTADFLVGKRVVFGDVEHRDFLIKLAENNGVIGKVMCGPSIEFVGKAQSYNGEVVERIINISLPPPPKTEPEKWVPKVGDLVKFEYNPFIYEVVVDVPDDEDNVCVKYQGVYSTVRVYELSKASSDDILRKEVLCMLSTFDPLWNPECLLEIIEGAGFKVVRK